MNLPKQPTIYSFRRRSDEERGHFVPLEEYQTLEQAYLKACGATPQGLEAKLDETFGEAEQLDEKGQPIEYHDSRWRRPEPRTAEDKLERLRAELAIKYEGSPTFRDLHEQYVARSKDRITKLEQKACELEMGIAQLERILRCEEAKVEARDETITALKAIKVGEVTKALSDWWNKL